MQNLTVCLQLEGIKGERVDPQGNPMRSKPPEITRGMESTLELLLRDQTGEPWENLEQFAAWEFYAGNDWDPDTPVMLAVTQGISAQGDSVVIPLRNTNTQNLAALMGNSEKISLHGELLGFLRGQELPALVAQFEIAVRNRVALSGSELPGELPSAYLTAGAVKALIAEETLANIPAISAGGTWVVAGVDTGIAAAGLAGPPGPQGSAGEKGEPGPRGEKGDKGDPMNIDVTGLSTDLSQYDSGPKGFSFLATDTGMIYIKNSDASGDWSDPVGFQGPSGKDGEDGYTPVRGTDYWTESDIAEIKTYVDETILNGAW